MCANSHVEFNKFYGIEKRENVAICKSTNFEMQFRELSLCQYNVYRHSIPCQKGHVSQAHEGSHDLKKPKLQNFLLIQQAPKGMIGKKIANH